MVGPHHQKLRNELDDSGLMSICSMWHTSCSVFSQYCQFENYGITCRSSFARLCKVIEMLETNRHVGYLSNSFRSFVNLVLLRRGPRADLRCILLHGLKMTDRSCSASCAMSYEPLHELSCLRSSFETLGQSIALDCSPMPVAPMSAQGYPIAISEKHCKMCAVLLLYPLELRAVRCYLWCLARPGFYSNVVMCMHVCMRIAYLIFERFFDVHEKVIN